MRRLFALILTVVWFGVLCNAQESKPKQKIITSYLDSLKYCWQTGNKLSYSSEFLITIADSVNGVDQTLLNGKIYAGYYAAEGFPFLFSKDPFIGQIIVNNIIYSPVKLLYDIYSDEVICIIKNKNLRENLIIMNRLFVNEFTLNNAVFKNFTNSVIGMDGYYELIYEGKNFSMVAKWSKTLEEPAHQEQQKQYFSDPGKTLFLIKNNKHKKVVNKNDFVAFLEIEKNMTKFLSKKRFPDLSIMPNSLLIDLCKSFDN